jgi:hypothetical protein
MVAAEMAEPGDPRPYPSAVLARAGVPRSCRASIARTAAALTRLLRQRIRRWPSVTAGANVDTR